MMPVLHPTQNIATSRRCMNGVCSHAAPPGPIGSQCHRPPRKMESNPAAGISRIKNACVFIAFNAANAQRLWRKPAATGGVVEIGRDG